MPFFSVIIPCYNRVDLVGQTLESVLNQQNIDPADLEVIAVDDGSTDGTLDLLQDLARRRGIRVLQQSNRGPGAARNLGLQHASGKYATFLDSDDLWFPWTLRTYRDVIDAHSNPAFVSGLQNRFTNASQILSAPNGELRVEAFADYYDSFDRWRWFGASSLVLRRDAVMAVGAFDCGWGVSEDADLAMKLGVAPGFVHITAPATFAYRVHGGNIMNNAGRIFVGTSLLLDHEKGGHYPGGTARRRQRLEIITRHARWCSFACLGAGERRMSWDLYPRTTTMHARLGRLKYLFGYPLVAFASRFHRGALPLRDVDREH